MLIPTLLTALATFAGAQEGPPGLVFVKGGKTKVGSDAKEVEPLVVRNRQYANTFAGEIPKHTVEVEDFWLMPNEVTNEQYAEFVAATGYLPPYYWADADALDEGRVTYLAEQGKARQEAIARGEQPGPRKKWDAKSWWEDNWQTTPWSVPEDILDSPVTYVSYDDAEAYARWAGLRLMTEFEYQRAGRGNSDQQYPWGGEWQEAMCNSIEHAESDEPMPVGSFEDAAVNGIYDLVGNVWEWTSSKYNKYPGYEALEIRNGRETIKGLAGFDPTYRVVVGGSFSNQAHACRIGVRMGSMRGQTTEAVGFRCAADTNSGLSAANWLLEKDVRLSKLPGQVEFKPEGSAILQRWETKPGTAKVPGYAVITKYERVLFTPLLELDAGSESDLTRKTNEFGPRIIGMLSFEFPLLTPELDGGTYFLAWRGKGKLRNSDDEEEEEPKEAFTAAVPFNEVPGFDEEEAQFFLYNLEGSPLVAWSAAPLEFKRPKEGSKLVYEKFVPPAEEPDEDAPPIIPMDTLKIDVVVDAKSRKAMMTTVEFKVAPGTMDETWK